METKTVTTVLGKKITLTDDMWFVVCTDKFLSGWGCADGKTAKRICVCKDLQDASKLCDRLWVYRNQHQLTDIYKTQKFPYFPESEFTTSIDEYSDSIYC